MSKVTEFPPLMSFSMYDSRIQHSSWQILFILSQLLECECGRE